MKSLTTVRSLSRLAVAFFSLVSLGIGTAHSCHYLDNGCETKLVQGYANTGAGSTFVQAGLDFVENTSAAGYGVKSGSESSYALDNNGNTELLVFKFDQAVVLDKVTFGYTNTDADFSVFAWVGASNANDSSVLGAISGKTVGNLATASTWKLIGNYSAALGATWDNQKSVDVNNGNLGLGGAQTSSWWIISAYNSSYGGNGGFDQGNDYMKVLGVACLPGSNGNNPVSEPASLLMLGGGLLGMMALRRRRQGTL